MKSKRYWGNYLRHCGGEWGPSDLPTQDLEEAAWFSTLEEALSYIKEIARSGGWGRLEAIPVQVAMEVLGRACHQARDETRRKQ